MTVTLASQSQLFVTIRGFGGDDEVAVKSVIGREAISELYRFEIAFTSKDDAIDLEKSLNSPVTITFRSESEERYVDGIVASLSHGATAAQDDVYVTEYCAVVKPKLWLLTLDRNYLIFQKKSTIDVIMQVLKDNGISDVEDRTKSCGKVVNEYCVQFGESSFDFISRLMEWAGIFYFFEHKAGKHTLVLADGTDGYGKALGSAPVRYAELVQDRMPIGLCFASQVTASINTGGYSQTDYNHTISQTNLFGTLDAKWEGPMLYEYPGKIAAVKEGDDQAKVRVQEFEVKHQKFEFSSTAIHLIPGCPCEIKGHTAAIFNKKVVILELHWSYKWSNNLGVEFENRFLAVEEKVPFRPLRRTPKPCVSGAQTAVVVCPSGEEIFRDAYCSVKVHFHWDQMGKKDGEDSCWIRVAQPLAGSNWGGIFVPRIGQEVVVVFLNGDPDRPLIVGCVYNDKYLPLYSDQDSMKTSLKTVTFKDPERYHEATFYDEKDKELFLFHVHKDIKVESVEGSRFTEFQSANGAVKDEYLMTEGDCLWTNKKGSVTAVQNEGDNSYTNDKGNFSANLKEGNSTIKLDKGNREITLGDGNQTVQIKGNYKLTISGDLTIKVDGNIVIESGKKTTAKSGQDTAMEAGTAFSIKGGTDFKGEAGTAMSLKSGTDTKVDVGMNLNAAAKMNVSVKGQMQAEVNGQLGVKIGGLQVEVAGQAMAKVSAPMIQIGGGMVQLG
ncbi:MAG: type VI secretion system tip protein VgrG [Holosporaceae bacterium]|jgi:type VI secretion system secreted protein VgrG|nr:type VI secretion system tip protein VgrG [Holosporaceae bacterium]